MKTKLCHEVLSVVGLLLVACGYPMQVSALPDYQFSFHQYSGFNVTTMTGTHGVNTNIDLGWYQDPVIPLPPTNPPNTYYNTLAWGLPYVGAGGLKTGVGNDPFGPAGNTGNSDTALSALRVLGHEGFITTGTNMGGGYSDWGDFQEISTIYHQNSSISTLSASLKTFTIYSELVFDQGSTNIPTPGNGIPVTFTETLNVPGPVDDYFQFDVSGFAPVYFAYGGHEYEVNFAIGLDSNSNLRTDFPTNSLVTVWTQENVTSHLNVLAQIREVPEPMSAFLFGLGVLGLSLARRRISGARLEK